MREEEVRGLFARTLETPPVPQRGTDQIIMAGRGVVRRRRTFTVGGSVLAAVVAVAVGFNVLQSGGGGAGLDGAGPTAAQWDPTGPADPLGDYSGAVGRAVAESMPQAEHDDFGEPPFAFAWNEDRTAIVTEGYLKISGGDALNLDVTIQEPRPGADVDERMEALAECADDCALSDLEDGRRLLTKEDQVTPDDFGPRTRYQAMIARPDGTVATAALRVDDNSPGTIALTMDQLIEVARALPETSDAPVGGPAPEDTGSSEAPPDGPDGPADPDGALLAAVENAVATFAGGAELSRVPYEGLEYEFTWGSTIGSKVFHGLLTFPDGKKYQLTVEIQSFRTKIPADGRAQLEARGKCGASDDCDYSTMLPDQTVLTKATAAEDANGRPVTLHRAWMTRSDDSFAGIFIEPFEDEGSAVPPVSLDTMVAMIGEIPLTALGS
ncbi:hypothetical protein AB0I28_07150 [Phytomonospora sp. NPDC050363]|uniref:hypothetical protein n=1 Tax=Phytomonospora sp. NPDC050363 TaxID=3155642 RepID=UPI00340CE51F